MNGMDCKTLAQIGYPKTVNKSMTIAVNISSTVASIDKQMTESYFCYKVTSLFVNKEEQKWRSEMWRARPNKIRMPEMLDKKCPAV